MGRKESKDLALKFLGVLTFHRLVLSGAYKPGDFDGNFEPPVFDLVIRKQGEDTFRDLISRIKAEIEQISYPVSLGIAYENMHGDKIEVRLRTEYAPDTLQVYNRKNHGASYEHATADFFRKLPKIVRDFQQKR